MFRSWLQKPFRKSGSDNRWDAIEMENTVTQGLGEEKNSGTEIFENGDSRKQLLARSRYLLYKSREK